MDTRLKNYDDIMSFFFEKGYVDFLLENNLFLINQKIR